MPFTNPWDVTMPPDTQLANLLGQDIRNLKLDTQQRMGAISGLSTALPLIGLDAQPANWTGLLFFATDTGDVYQWSGSTWVKITLDFFDATSFTNASATTGIIIPNNLIVPGSKISVAFNAVQNPGAAAFSFIFAGSIEVTIPINSGGSTLNWYLFIDIFFDAIGISGHYGGQFRAAAFGGSGFLAGAMQANLLNTTSAVINAKAQIGAGTTVGPLTATIVTP